MAVEAKRGCGYRKKGGTYLVSGKLELPCDRMPFELDVCPCCGAGVKPSRSWTWIDPVKLFGEHEGCGDVFPCPMCQPALFFGEKTLVNGETLEPPKKAGLIWIGEKFYTPTEFIIEASHLGISRRIAALPRGFKLGETFVFLAHKDAVTKWDTESLDEDWQFGALFNKPGIFCCFRPMRIEYIVDQSELDVYEHICKEIACTTDKEEIKKLQGYETYKKLQGLIDRGFTLVPVPDDDPDHH